MKRILQGSVLLLLMSALFSACMKNDGPQPNIPAGGLMAFNLSPDADGIGIKLDGNNLVNQPLRYTNYTGAYLPVYTGNRSTWAYDYYSGVTLTPKTGFNSVDSQYYSLFVVSADSNFKTVVVNDRLDTIHYNAGHAFVRYINAVADSVHEQHVTLSAGGADLVSENAAFAHISGFALVPAGNLAVAVKNAGAGVDASRTIELEANKIYTVLLIGRPGATGDKAVQIKFVANGAVSEDKSAAH